MIRSFCLALLGSLLLSSGCNWDFGSTVTISIGDQTYKVQVDDEAALTAPSVDGSGVMATELRSLGTFDRVTVRAPFKITVQVGEPSLVRVTTDDNLQTRIATQVTDGDLFIGPTGPFSTDAMPRIEIGVESLAAVRIRGMGDVEVTGVDGEEFAGSIAGGGSLRVIGTASSLSFSIAGSGEIDAGGTDSKSIDVDVAGSGEVILAGTAANLMIEIAGSGEVDASQLKASDVDVEIAGSGDVVVHAEDALDVSIAGSGDVRYHGSPKVSRSIAGSGNVQQLQ